MIRIVCADVDGTLVGPSRTVHPSVWQAAERVRAAGIRIAICSGRPAFGITREYADRIDRDGWHIFQNGSSVVQFSSGQSHSGCLTSETVAGLIQRAREADRDLELYTDDGYFVESQSPRARAHAELLGVPFTPRPLDSVRDPIVRAQWLLSHDEASVVMAEPHPGIEFSPSLSPVMPDTLFLSLMPRGVDKGTGVRAVAEEYGVGMHQVMFVGDGMNDAPALAVVGYPIAMGNAEPEARALAHRVVAGVDEGGLADAFELALQMRVRT
ncbi:MAG: Cof-type HAD-IIB family hydrolase [Gemmatimonadaceae bacterium]